ncbi:unnamed protein product, partial [Symbiodinium pilosum]
MLDVGRMTFLQQLQHQGSYANLGFALCLRGAHGVSALSLGEVDDLIQAAEKQAGAQGLTLKVQGLETVSQLRAGYPGVDLFWMVPMDLRVKGPVVEAPSNIQLELTGFGMLDSGTSLLLLSEKPLMQTLAALTYRTNAMEQIRDNGGCGVGTSECFLDCRTTKLNPLTTHFTSEGRELEVVLESSDLLVPVHQAKDGTVLCQIGLGLLTNEQTPLPMMVLGDVFLRKVHVIHDMAGPAVTLVPDVTDRAEVVHFVESHEGHAEAASFDEGRGALQIALTLPSLTLLEALLLLGGCLLGYLAFASRV